jgi:3'-5' exonuclease
VAHRLIDLDSEWLIGHDIKFDALWLARKCNVHLVKMFDTSSASRILSNGRLKSFWQKIMVSVFETLFKKQIPIEVDAKTCENWGENEGVCDICAAQIGD